jgi:hypothetical protein
LAGRNRADDLKSNIQVSRRQQRQAAGQKNQASFFYFLGSASAADLDDLCADGLTH